MVEGRSNSPTPSSRSSKDRELIVSAKEVKVPLPKRFNGDRSKLKEFLIQMELYFNFHPIQFRDEKSKVL